MRLHLAALLPFVLLTVGCGGDDDPTEPQTGELVVRSQSVTDAAPVGPSSSSAAASRQSGDPTSYVVGFYRFYLAANADCSSPVLLGSNSSIRSLDLLTNPVLFTVSGTPGSYECIVMSISDVFSFVPATSFGPCTAGTTYQVDTYYDGETDFVDVDGNPITGSGDDASPVDNQVDVFFSTNPAAVIARGYSPNQVVPLENGPTIPGAATFVYDVRGQVIDENGECRSAGGTYTFR